MFSNSETNYFNLRNTPHNRRNAHRFANYALELPSGMGGYTGKFSKFRGTSIIGFRQKLSE